MKRILVGYDGSEPSRHALGRAAELAVAMNASITVLNAAAEHFVRADGVETPAADEGQALAVADEGAARARELGASVVDSRVSFDSPVEAIVDAAREGYDLVVVGHRGLGALQELFLGSTAKAVVDRLECSVLVVR